MGGQDKPAMAVMGLPALQKHRARQRLHALHFSAELRLPAPQRGKPRDCRKHGILKLCSVLAGTIQNTERNSQKAAGAYQETAKRQPGHSQKPK